MLLLEKYSIQCRRVCLTSPVPEVKLHEPALFVGDDLATKSAHLAIEHEGFAILESVVWVSGVAGHHLQFHGGVSNVVGREVSNG